MTYKNIKIKKKGGGTRIQRVRVLKSGKYQFVKNVGSKSKNLTKNNKKRKMSYMPKKKRRNGKRKFTLPLAPIVGVVAMPSLQATANAALKGQFQEAMVQAKGVVGITRDGAFNAQLLISNIAPLVVGGLVHKFVGGAPLNVNRMLASAGVPVIRI